MLCLMFPEKGHDEALGDRTPFVGEPALYNKLNGYIRHKATFAFRSVYKGNINQWRLLLSRRNCIMQSK